MSGELWELFLSLWRVFAGSGCMEKTSQKLPVWLIQVGHFSKPLMEALVVFNEQNRRQSRGHERRGGSGSNQ